MEKDEKDDFNFEEEYQKLEEKFNLPKLKDLSEDFEVEKLFEKESDFIIREIRRSITDKISAYLNLFETLINPTSPPMFVFSLLRGLKEEDKPLLREIYKKLSKVQIRAMSLDTIYDEKREAEFVKKTFEEWQELKKQIHEIFLNFEENFEKENGTKKREYYN